jgi:hypothetical protein
MGDQAVAQFRQKEHDKKFCSEVHIDPYMSTVLPYFRKTSSLLNVSDLDQHA